MALAQAQNGGRGNNRGRGGGNWRGGRRGGRRGGAHHPHHYQHHHQPYPQPAPIINVLTPPMMEGQQFFYNSPQNHQTQGVNGGGGQGHGGGGQGTPQSTPQPQIDITAVATLETVIFQPEVKTLIIGDATISLIQKRQLPNSYQVVCLPGIRIVNLEETLPSLLQNAPATLERISIIGGLSDLRCGAGAVYARSLTSLVKAISLANKDTQILPSLVPLFKIKNPPTPTSTITEINNEIRESIAKLRKNESVVKLLDLERPFLTAEDPSRLTMNDGYSWSQKGGQIFIAVLQDADLLPN